MLNYVISKSGDSTLQYFDLKNGVLKVIIYINELDLNLNLRIRSRRIACEAFSNFVDIDRTCYIKLLPLNNLLNSERHRYMPARSFNDFMKECKNHLNLAYGMEISDESYYFSLRNMPPLLTYIIDKLSTDMEWDLTDQV
jgi:hypothetical protein